MDKEITPMDLLQAKVASASDNLSLLEKLLKGLNNFFSQEDLDQKTIIQEINAIGMTEIEDTNEYLKKYLGETYYDRITQKLIERRRVNNKSVEALGLQKMIDFVEAFSGKQEIKTQETMADKVKRMS
jgi:hypothetical protein